MHFLYFLHDLSLSAEIQQAIRNRDYKHLLHMGHRFFAIIDDKIPEPYTNTCYHHLPCQNIESVERTPHSRTQTAAVLPPRLVQGNCDPNQLKHQQTAAVPTQLRTEIKQKDRVPAPNSRHQQPLSFLPSAPVYVSKDRERKFLGENFPFLNWRWKVLNSALNNKTSIASE